MINVNVVKNFIKPLLEQLVSLIGKRKTDSIAWIGVHPWLSQIYQFLSGNGIRYFYVMDNDQKKHGDEIWKLCDKNSTSPLFKLNNERFINIPLPQGYYSEDY